MQANELVERAREVSQLLEVLVQTSSKESPVSVTDLAKAPHDTMRLPEMWMNRAAKVRRQ